MASPELSKQLSKLERQEDELDLPTHTKRDLAAVDSALATSIHLWLRKRRKNVRPKLNADQQHQLKECFELMDQDGSGAIDADELGAAFKLLGIGLRKSEIEQILDEVGMNADGEVEYPQFLEIMTVTLQRLAEEQAEDNNGASQVPFSLMATAYRRKRLMEGIISGDKETMGQIVQLSERQAQESAMRDAASAAAAARKAEASKRDPQHQQHQKLMSSVAKRSMARLARMHVDEGLIMQLGPEERRLLHQVATRTQRQQHHQQPLADAGHLRQAWPQSPSLLSPPKSPPYTQRSHRHAHDGSMPQSVPKPSFFSPRVEGVQSPPSASKQRVRAATADGSCLPRLRGGGGVSAQFGNGRFSQLPKHQQLIGVPQCFDIKFSRPTVHGAGSATSKCQTSGLPFPSATRPLRDQFCTAGSLS